MLITALPVPLSRNGEVLLGKLRRYPAWLKNKVILSTASNHALSSHGP